MDIDMTAVESRMCTHIGYNEELQEFYMRHKNGQVSVFSEVPASIAHAVASADSVGGAYHRMIKDQFRHHYAP
jgi:hypothetical protein